MGVARQLRCGFAMVLFLGGLVSAGADEVPLVEVIVVEDDDGSYTVIAHNNHIIPVYVAVDLPDLVNLAPDRDLPVSFGLEAGARDIHVLTLNPVRRTGRLGYSLQYSFAQGNPETASHEDGHLYVMPFEHGRKFRLSQGFHGKFSHSGENEYAVDFEMDEGTPVHAARGGLVAEVKEDSRTGGPSASYSNDANYVLVLHEDGSFGNYAHLMTEGAVVEPGDRITAGQLLGYSGNTGRSSGPHLHFDVRLPTFDGRMLSVPFLFAGRAHSPTEPEEGRFYYSYHPGAPPFEEVLGASVTVEDYSDYLVPFDGAQTIDVRVQQIDLTFLIFVQNGLAGQREVEIRFQLSGLQSDAGETVRLTVPGRSEMFATVLRPLPGAESIRYSYTISYTR